MSRYERIRDDHERYLADVRMVCWNRSGGRCEVQLQTIIKKRDGTRMRQRCNHDLMGERWELAHMVERGKIEREALRRGLSKEEAWRASWQPCVVRVACPTCNDAALVGRGVREYALIDQAIEEARHAAVPS